MIHEETIKILNDLPRVTVEEYRRHLIDLMDGDDL